MEVEIAYGPGAAAAKIRLSAAESLTAEGGSMIAVSAGVSVTTTTHKKGSGSFLKAAKRLLSGESFFLNHYSGGAGGGEVWIAPTLAGDIVVYELKGEGLIVQAGSF